MLSKKKKHTEPKMKKRREKKPPREPSRAGIFFDRYFLLFHIPIALLLIFIIEALSHHSLESAVDFVKNHTGAYLYNAFCVYIVLTAVLLVRRRLFLRTLLLGLLLILGLINCVILLKRVSPFGLTDVNMVGDFLTMKNTNYISAPQAAAAVAALILFVVFLVRLFVASPKANPRLPLYIRVGIVLACFFSLPLVTKTLQERNVISSYFGNLAQGYQENGFLYGFASSVFARGMTEPADYTQAHIDQILTATDQGESTMDAANGPNIVVILLESFFDVSECKFVETNEDPTPFYHTLESLFSTGYFTAPVVGAGTCNSEFEVLTGMSVRFFGPGEYPQKTVFKNIDRCESSADILKDLGYGTHVVHNNGGNFYSRAHAFSLMGFDSFQSKEMLDITDYTPLGSWPRDEILIDASRDALETTEGPDYLYTITVETHGAYPKEDILGDDAPIQVTCRGKDEATTNMWKYYINMLHSEDEFLRKYIEMFAERKEDTLVIMFGDHLPTMGLSADEVKTGDLYKTKYITWNNFGMPKEDMDLAAYQFVPEFFNRLGIHGGTIIDYNQAKTAEGLDPKSNEYMDDLELLQYDLLYGERLAYHDEDAYPASDLEMGVKDIEIDKAYLFNGKLHIYGDNFSKWSRVYVNGDKVSTSYESGQVLTIDADSVKNGDEIVVSQVGSSSTIFRSSKGLIFFDPNVAEEEKEEDAVVEDTEPAEEPENET